ncbi:MAG: P-loop NTPase [Pseudonocardia sp.]|nr:P-loop NTPase [Pseudonocardia sp.]
MSGIEESNSSPPIIAVGSGKGGVGKTTISVRLARELRNIGLRVGLVDADLHAPDIPRLLGFVRSEPAHQVTVMARRGSARSRLEPLVVEGLYVASAGVLLASDQSLTISAEIAHLLLARLLNQTLWPTLDVLVLDLPPGTAEFQQLALTTRARTAALLVVTPDDLAHLDTRRLVELLRRVRVTTLGGIENMAGLRCPGCGLYSRLYPETSSERSIWNAGVKKLTELPFQISSEDPAQPQPNGGFEPVIDAVATFLAKPSDHP